MRPIEVIVSDRQTSATRAPSFRARVFAGPDLCRSATPIYEAARALIDLGHDPESLMAAYHEEGLRQINKPQMLVYLARWAVSEGQAGLRLVNWQPRPELEA